MTATPKATTAARRPLRVVEGSALESAIDVPTLLDEIAAGFVAYSAGRTVVPPVGYLPLHDPEGSVHIKYGYALDDDVWVAKIASGVDANVALGVPAGDGLMIVFDRRTSAPLAVLLDHARLTDIRTAAAGAVVARALGPKRIDQIGIFGAGVQGRLQLRLLSHVTSCRRVLVWSRTPGRAESMAAELRADGFDVRPAPADEVAASCNLIVTATAAANALFHASAVRPGTHITAVGADAPGKMELEPALLARAAWIVVDSRSQTFDHGEMVHALKSGLIDPARVRELGEVLADPSLYQRRDDDISVCDLTGVAIQDIVIAKHVLNRLGDRW